MCHEKRLSNHSVQKTVVRKSEIQKIQNSKIITITGHHQKQSVEASDSVNKDKQWQLSNIIDGKENHFNQTTSRVPPQLLIQSTAAVSGGHNCNVVINQGHAGQADASYMTSRDV